MGGGAPNSLRPFDLREALGAITIDLRRRVNR
jgi:hypothetical protein